MKFAAVGIFSFVVDWLLLVILTEGFGIDYLVSTTVSFLVSVSLNYALSMKYVFEHRDDMSRKREFTIFAILSCIGLGLTDVLMFAGVTILNIAYQAMNGKKGAVGVYNYETGEILCMVSTPTFDPANPPTIEDGDPQYEGVYLNRFLSGTFTPGSVFKTITLTAAIENIPDLFSRSFTCTGSTTVGGEEITCPFAHGEMDINSALANSCNGVFAQVATELGAETMSKYVEKAGILDSYSVDG